MFELLADGERTGKPVTLDGKLDETGEATAWTASWSNLPKYKIVNGVAEEIEYKVEEVTPWPGYTAAVTIVATGETITNKQVKTSANGTKAWENADGTTDAPDGATVTFELLADGERTGKQVVLDGTPDETGEATAWTASWSNLPKYKIVNGAAEAIEYKVEEVTPWPGYTAAVTVVATGETITNKQVKTSANGTKAWENVRRNDRCT